MTTTRTAIDDYIDGFPPKVKARLKDIRETVRRHAPGASEKMSYRMPAFDLNGTLVWFAAYEHHIGFYPTGSGIAAFIGELAPFKSSKGAVQFPHDAPLPMELIARMVEYRVAQCAQKPKRRKGGTSS